MKTAYIFDVDGTLAPPNEPIDSQFMHWLEHWMTKRDAYLCTNNTYQNILPRLGNRLLTSCKALFTSGGNSIWMNGKEAVISNWRPSPDLLTMLSEIVKDSDFKIRSGPNIEYRTGLISFSVLGKSANKEERQRYIAWDTSSRERKKITKKIMETFPGLEVFIAGETSIDICQKDCNKSQILKYFGDEYKINFFANETYNFGNDKPLVDSIYKKKITGNTVYTVKDWQETFNILKKIK